MNDIQKTIKILEDIQKNISKNISMKEVSETLSIMFGINENDNFESTIKDFIEALYIKYRIDKGLEDVKNGRVYTTQELKNELGI